MPATEIEGPRGHLYIVSAPSGAGKSSLNKALMARDSRLKKSVSYTTRAPRTGETNGIDYNFITLEEFNRKKVAGDFLETAHVHGNYYGTCRLWIEEALNTGAEIILEIDWQGARQVKTIFPEATAIFILPPSMPVLEKRLRGRATDAPDVIARRLSGAALEISQAPHFDYIVINDDFEKACEELHTIVKASRLTFSAQKAAKSALFASFGL
ncbi:MAG TPA: guanylate kinase [Sutterella sp.]|nr:guanylate kinase [Sutterella sp.]